MALSQSAVTGLHGSGLTESEARETRMSAVDANVFCKTIQAHTTPPNLTAHTRARTRYWSTADEE